MFWASFLLIRLNSVHERDTVTVRIRLANPAFLGKNEGFTCHGTEFILTLDEVVKLQRTLPAMSFGNGLATSTDPTREWRPVRA